MLVLSPRSLISISVVVFLMLKNVETQKHDIIRPCLSTDDDGKLVWLESLVKKIGCERALEVRCDAG